jgi:hypothetical protein
VAATRLLVAFRAMWHVSWLSHCRLLLLVLVVALVGALPAVAHASPPDQSWLGGLWDNDDYDDVILLITDFTGAPTPAPLILPRHMIYLAEIVLAPEVDFDLVERSPDFLRRAPPAA